MSAHLSSARRELRTSQAVLAQRTVQTAESRRRLDRKLRGIRPGWIIGAGLSLGLIAGSLPQRTIAAFVGAMAGFALKLLNTPLGPMAIGAALSRRQQGENDHGRPRDDASSD